ncbi:transglycosylase SLT domain-containing protein [Arenicella xantha]|uniref:Transglycosylase SLT domain-containing protein n=1 Tax=Arenicella xantha TaxID=644221 RepID=A0A395JQP9_9GAMM|nr:transglycosylase SLT domain-containing protein [Arenicella xantha]RBP52652.1 hypothetical protein DFR28_10134 [Arenicella xantha]
MFSIRILRLLVVASICGLLIGCASRPLSNKEDVCAIFNDKPHWYQAAKRSTERWGGPIHVPMAIIYQESTFTADAKPKMQYFLGIIPTGRPSDAYGYAQALKSTWREYEIAVGSRSPDRDDFSDAVDFVLWYMNVTYQRNGVSKWDAYGHYLNYHEGQGGYSRGSHLSKQWLLNTAKRVDTRAKKFATQLSQCRAELDSKKRGWF